MKLLPLLALLLCSCGTTLYNPRTGAPLARFTSDMDESEYRGGGVYWKVKNHRPSRTIIAGGNATTKVITAAGTAVVTQGIWP